MAVSEKEKALQTALAQIEKQFGKGAVMKLGQNSSLNVEAIPTGSHRAGNRRRSKRKNHRNLWTRKFR